MIIYYTPLEIWCMTDVMIFHFGLFFALLPPSPLPSPPTPPSLNNLKNQNYTCAPKIIITCLVPEICCMRSRWKKWHIEVGGPSKKWVGEGVYWDGGSRCGGMSKFQLVGGDSTPTPPEGKILILGCIK